MGIISNLKAQKALVLQSKGEVYKANKLYEEAIASGLNKARYLLAYSVLLIKNNEFEKAKQIILKAEKSTDISSEQKKQVYVNYGICLFFLDEKEKALSVLEKEHSRGKSGLIYQTLGYLYIQAGEFEKGYNYISESLEYDPEDSINLENMAHYYYRKPEPDKNKAREYFTKANIIRPTQIDSLYFLAKYDLEDGNKNLAKEKLEKALKGNFSPLNYATKEEINELLSAK